MKVIKKSTSIGEINCEEITSNMLSHIFLLDVFTAFLDENTELNLVVDTVVFGTRERDRFGIVGQT
jgi:hypothetical protein